MRRPLRPFGVTLAILSSLLLFTILPLMEIGIVLLVRLRFMSVQLIDDGIQPVAIGGDFLGFSPILGVLQTVFAVAFLIIAILAWRGRPPYIRFGMVIAVLGLTLFRFAIIIAPKLVSGSIENGIDSGASVWDALGLGQLLSGIPILLYVAWYMNRAPARAFYRGYFLSDEVDKSVAS
ncbi:MAG: hypothetical protein R3E39_07305 [Anaerolineae bacterium]